MVAPAADTLPLPNDASFVRVELLAGWLRRSTSGAYRSTGAIAIPGRDDPSASIMVGFENDGLIMISSLLLAPSVKIYPFSFLYVGMGGAVDVPIAARRAE